MSSDRRAPQRGMLNEEWIARGPSRSRWTKNNAKAARSRNSTVQRWPGTLIPERVKGRLSGPFQRDFVTLGRSAEIARLRKRLTREVGVFSALLSEARGGPRRHASAVRVIGRRRQPRVAGAQAVGLPPASVPVRARFGRLETIVGKSARTQEVS